MVDNIGKKDLVDNIGKKDLVDNIKSKDLVDNIKRKDLSPIYTAENVWHGPDKSCRRTKRIVLITHLHVLFSTVLNDVKL